MTPKISENNFDLIRLFAASQVAILHVIGYISPSLSQSPLAILLDLFPGVPIFFFISGFLISRSFEKTGSVVDYARNRSLRIFPALHVCVIFNLVIVGLTGYFATQNVDALDILLLYLAKTTIFQFYNPSLMRQFGDGVLNGSLWTICVELQFYFLTPVIYKLFVSANRNKTNIAIMVIIAISMVMNRLLYDWQHDYSMLNSWKLFRVSFLPWLYMFLTGVLVQINFQTMSKVLRKNLFIFLLPAYLTFALIMRNLGFSFLNSVGPIIFFPLVLTVFVTAFSAPTLAKRLLHGNDISYGIYIYHVPVMNMFLYYHLEGAAKYTALILTLSTGLALLSWFLIERPSMHLKRKAARPIDSLNLGEKTHG